MLFYLGTARIPDLPFACFRPTATPPPFAPCSGPACRWTPPPTRTSVRALATGPCLLSCVSGKPDTKLPPLTSVCQVESTKWGTNYFEPIQIQTISSFFPRMALSVPCKIEGILLRRIIVGTQKCSDLLFPDRGRGFPASQPKAQSPAERIVVIVVGFLVEVSGEPAFWLEQWCLSPSAPPIDFSQAFGLPEFGVCLVGSPPPST